MNYNTPSPAVPPITPWHQAHCYSCYKRAISTPDVTANFTQWFSCLTIYCNRCIISQNGYYGATEAFRSTKICPQCAKSNLLESHIILQSRNRTFRRAFVVYNLNSKIDLIITRYIKLFL